MQEVSGLWYDPIKEGVVINSVGVQGNLSAEKTIIGALAFKFSMELTSYIGSALDNINWPWRVSPHLPAISFGLNLRF